MRVELDETRQFCPLQDVYSLAMSSVECYLKQQFYNDPTCNKSKFAVIGVLTLG